MNVNDPKSRAQRELERERARERGRGRGRWVRPNEKWCLRSTTAEDEYETTSTTDVIADPAGPVSERQSRRLLHLGGEGRDSTQDAIAALPGEGGDWAVPFERSPALNLTPENAIDAPAAALALGAPVLDYERLDVFRVALEFTTLVPALTKTARPAMRDQLERAAASVCLNLAEGCGRRARRDRLHFFSIAQGSAMECAAAIDILRALRQTSHEDATSAKHKIARVVQMLVGLRRR